VKMNPPRKLTKEERAAIRTLERLAKRWPKTLVLFGASKLYVFDASMAARHEEFDRTGKMSEWAKQTVLARINIDCDGGDPW